MNHKQLIQNIKEIKEYLDADAFYHAKMSLNRLIQRLETPESCVDEKQQKEISDLVNNRPNLSPPTQRYVKPNNGCIR